jgi:hypothetical protein
MCQLQNPRLLPQRQKPPPGVTWIARRRLPDPINHRSQWSAELVEEGFSMGLAMALASESDFAFRTWISR